MSITSTLNPKITNQNGTILTNGSVTINSYTNVSNSSQFLVSSYLSFTFFDVLAFYTKLWE